MTNIDAICANSFKDLMLLTSIPHRSYVSLNGYTWSVCVHENA